MSTDDFRRFCFGVFGDVGAGKTSLLVGINVNLTGYLVGRRERRRSMTWRF
jgi:Ni2+-binding GTPase involved in maturation of urease and hydrogenase